MTLKKILLGAAEDPKALREALESAEVARKFELAGIDFQIYQLHAPALGAKKTFGLGITLCGRSRGMRNQLVTCKKCLAKLDT